MTILNRQITPNISLYELLFTPTVTMREILPFIEQAWSIEVDRNLTRTATAIQIVRDYYNKPVIITSGYRPTAWEIKQGRKGGSQHTTGLAVDFYVVGVPLAEVYAFINATFKKGGRAINPKAKFIHLDLRPEYATWSY
jgi:uncharacterized protein YcbK (DUF882 family)